MVRSLKTVIESAFVHRPTRRALNRVTVIKERGAVKPALDVIIDRDYTQQMPLAECGGFDAGARELMALSLVSKEREVVLEGRTLSNTGYELLWGVHQGESNATFNLPERYPLG